MSSKGYVESLLNSLQPDQKRLFFLAFGEVMDHARLGDDAKALNFDWFKVTSTTASDANTEFSVEHGMDSAPSKLLPYLDLSQVGSQVVPLTVSRAPDAGAPPRAPET